MQEKVQMDILSSNDNVNVRDYTGSLPDLGFDITDEKYKQYNEYLAFCDGKIVFKDEVVTEGTKKYEKYAKERELLQDKVGTINDVVQDGLILNYDGINNTGSGHVADTTSWKNLVSEETTSDGVLNNFTDFTDANSTWEDNCVVLDGVNDFIIGNIALSSDKGTIEIVLRPIKNNYVAYAFQSSLFVRTYFRFASNNNFAFTVDDPEQRIGPFLNLYNKSFTATFKWSKDGLGKVSGIGCYNGTIATSRTNISSNRSVSTFKLGKHSSEDTMYKGIIYSVRIYNRELTDEEVRYNYLLDKARYGI